MRKTPKELREIAEIIEPLIAKGQSLNHICQTHADELDVSERTERTLYNYIDILRNALHLYLLTMFSNYK